MPRARAVRSATLFVLASALLLPAHAGAQWVAQRGNTTSSLRGLSVVSERVAWASGTNGRFARTLDGGERWLAGTVPGAEGLDFRDVEAFDARTAFLMSAGEGAASRIYKTNDGGRTWTQLYALSGREGFFDSMAFWDRSHGIIMSDPVGGRFLVLTTADGGRTWVPAPPGAMPMANPGEAAFAASGTALVVEGKRNAWFATGGGPKARVFRTTDRGMSWSVAETPVMAGSASAGIFSLAFSDRLRGIAVGGDYQHPERSGANVAITVDGGATWTVPEGPLPSGYRSCVAVMPGTRGTRMVAVGTTGSDVSSDGGRSWRLLAPDGFNTVALARRGGWAVGASGKIARLALSPR